MPLLYHAYVYLEFLILACTIYIRAPELLKQLVHKKLAKGQSMEVIAEDLVEDVEVIRTIVDEIQTEK